MIACGRPYLQRIKSDKQRRHRLGATVHRMGLVPFFAPGTASAEKVPLWSCLQALPCATHDELSVPRANAPPQSGRSYAPAAVSRAEQPILTKLTIIDFGKTYEGFCEEVGRFGAFLVFSRPQKPLKTVLLGSALSLSMPVFSQWRRRLEKFLRCNRKRFFYVKTQTQMLCFVVLTSYFCSKQLSTLDK